MIEKLCCLVKWKYSWILLLVPYLNLVFVVLFLLFAPWKHYLYIIPALFLGSLAMHLLTKLISDQNSWCIPLIVTTLLSLLSFIYLKQRNFDFYMPARRKNVQIIIYFAVVAVILLTAFI